MCKCGHSPLRRTCMYVLSDEPNVFHCNKARVFKTGEWHVNTQCSLQSPALVGCKPYDLQFDWQFDALRTEQTGNIHYFTYPFLALSSIPLSLSFFMTPHPTHLLSLSVNSFLLFLSLYLSSPLPTLSLHLSLVSLSLFYSRYIIRFFLCLSFLFSPHRHVIFSTIFSTFLFI